jgi:hypothetical protein
MSQVERKNNISDSHAVPIFNGSGVISSKSKLFFFSEKIFDLFDCINNKIFLNNYENLATQTGAVLHS